MLRKLSRCRRERPDQGSLRGYRTYRRQAGQSEQTKPYEMTLGHQVSGVAGILVVAVLNHLGLDLSGPGLEGAIRAGLFYGVGGFGGGLVIYEVVQRFRYRLGRPRQAGEQ
jgi:hypothetical protein